MTRGVRPALLALVLALLAAGARGLEAPPSPPLPAAGASGPRAERPVRLAKAPPAAARPPPRASHAAVMTFAEELRELLELHLPGLCGPPPHRPPRALAYKLQGERPRGNNASECGCPAAGAGGGGRRLAARLAELSLRASMMSRSHPCDSQLAVSLAHTFGELARRASRAPPALDPARASGASAEGAGAGSAEGVVGEVKQKTRKLSKSQKSKLQAKQKTAVAVKKKAAAAAAAAAAVGLQA